MDITNNSGDYQRESAFEIYLKLITYFLCNS